MSLLHWRHLYASIITRKANITLSLYSLCFDCLLHTECVLIDKLVNSAGAKHYIIPTLNTIYCHCVLFLIRIATYVPYFIFQNSNKTPDCLNWVEKTDFFINTIFCYYSPYELEQFFSSATQLTTCERDDRGDDYVWAYGRTKWFMMYCYQYWRHQVGNFYDPWGKRWYISCATKVRQLSYSSKHRIFNSYVDDNYTFRSLNHNMSLIDWEQSECSLCHK